MRRSRAICGDAQSAVSRRTLPCKALVTQPRNAERSGRKKRNKCRRPKRSELCRIFSSTPLRVAPPEATFQPKAKGDSFFKAAQHRCEEAFCQLNIEVSSLQVLSEFNSWTVQPPIRSWSWPACMMLLYASVRE